MASAGGFRAELRAEACLLLESMCGTKPLLPLPPGDWRRWAAHSAVLSPRSYLRAKAALTALMMTTLIAFFFQCAPGVAVRADDD
jgi:hypothetical protein